MQIMRHHKVAPMPKYTALEGRKRNILIAQGRYAPYDVDILPGHEWGLYAQQARVHNEPRQNDGYDEGKKH